MSQQHSELPWSIGTNGDKCARNHAICTESRVIAKVYGTGYPAGQGWSPQSETDAAFIVQAVNAHEAMREALREVQHINQDESLDLEQIADRLDRLQVKVRAALALADGQVAGEASTDMFGNDLSKADSFGTAREAKL